MVGSLSLANYAQNRNDTFSITIPNWGACSRVTGNLGIQHENTSVYFTSVSVNNKAHRVGPRLN